MIVISFASDISLHGNNVTIHPDNKLNITPSIGLPHIEDTIDRHKKVIVFIKVNMPTF